MQDQQTAPRKGGVGILRRPLAWMIGLILLLVIGGVSFAGLYRLFNGESAGVKQVLNHPSHAPNAPQVKLNKPIESQLNPTKQDPEALKSPDTQEADKDQHQQPQLDNRLGLAGQPLTAAETNPADDAVHSNETTPSGVIEDSDWDDSSLHRPSEDPVIITPTPQQPGKEETQQKELPFELALYSDTPNSAQQLGVSQEALEAALPYRLYVAHVNTDEAPEVTLTKLQAAYPPLKEAELYLIPAFEDPSYVVLALPRSVTLETATGEKVTNLKNFDQTLIKPQNGLFISQGSPLAQLATQTDCSEYAFGLVSGRPAAEDEAFAHKIKAPKKLIGAPHSILNCAVELPSDAVLVQGLSIQAQEIAGEDLQFNTVLYSEKDLDQACQIVGNTIDFGEASREAVGGIAVGRVKTAVDISFNHILGRNVGSELGFPPTSRGAIQITTRLDPQAQAQISHNKIASQIYHGIGVVQGKDSHVSITHNHIVETGQNAILVSAFDTPENTVISGNVIDSWGTRSIERKKNFTSTEKIPTNDFEIGILLEYIDPVYGTQVNSEWFNRLDKVSKRITETNKIADKRANDQLEGVMDSTPVTVGRARTYNDPKQALNQSRERLSNKTVVVVFDEDGDLTLGQDPNHPEKERIVENLRIVGPAHGTIILPPTLKVTGTLILDVPNAQINLQAQVGKLETVATAGEDKSTGHFEFSEAHGTKLTDSYQLVRGHAPQAGIVARLTDLRDGAGQPIRAEQTDLTNHLKIQADGQLLQSTDYAVEEEQDQITFKAEWLNTLAESVTLSIKYEEPSVIKTSVVGQLVITVSDKTAFQIEPISSLEYFQGRAPESGIQLKIKGVVGIDGKALSEAETVLTGAVKVQNSSLNQAKPDEIKVDDETDTVTLLPAFLNRVAANDRLNEQPFSYLGRITLTLENVQQNLGQASKEFQLKVKNYSSARFEWVSAQTFTDGKAPQEGISLRILAVRDVEGKPVSPSQTQFKTRLHIEPFPVNWNTEMIGMGDSLQFNPKHYQYDEQTDILTFKAEYLNTIRPGNDAQTEAGVKQFNITVYDQALGVDVRSDKLLLHIKKLEKAPSDETGIESDLLQIDPERSLIQSGTESLADQLTVGQLRAKLNKKNPRQQIRVFARNHVQHKPAESAPTNPETVSLRGPGKAVTLADKMAYKNDYEQLRFDDVVVVIAEDGITLQGYALDLKKTETTSLLLGAQSPVSHFDQAVVLLAPSEAEKSLTVGDLLTAIQLAPDVKAEVFAATDTKDLSKIKNLESLGQAFEPQQVLPDQSILQLSKGDQKERRIVLVTSQPKYRALLVGNSNYGNEKLNLSGPVNDLKLMKQLFAVSQHPKGGGFSEIQVKENQTKQQFLQAIAETFKAARPSDVSYLYYSGHGNNYEGTSYICTVNEAGYEPQSEQEAAHAWISVNELHEALKAIPGTKVLILDSCNAGGFIGKDFVDASSGATSKPEKPTDPSDPNHPEEPGDPGDLDDLDDLDGLDSVEVLRTRRVDQSVGARESQATARTFIQSVETVFGQSAPVLEREQTPVIRQVRSLAEKQALSYLTEPEFKVLAASSGNEYSFEDKKEQIGKFTKQLSLAMGMDQLTAKEPTQVMMPGDKNNDRGLSLQEAYDYLTDHVAYTSHIQVFPRQDPFVLFALAKDSQPLSDVVDFSAKPYQNAPAYKVIKRGNKPAIINSGTIVISDQLTVSAFLAYLQPGVEGQKLYVVSKAVNTVDQAKAPEDHLARQDFLMVVAPAGNTLRIPITVKGTSPQPGGNPGGSLLPPPPSSQIMPDFGTALKVHPAFKSIQSGDYPITAQTTVQDILNLLKNRQAFREIQVIDSNTGLPVFPTQVLTQMTRWKFIPVRGEEMIYTLRLS